MTSAEGEALRAEIEAAYKSALPEVVGAVLEPNLSYVVVHVNVDSTHEREVTVRAESLKLADRFSVPIRIVAMRRP